MEDLDIYINRLKINIFHKICILLVYSHIPLKHLISVEPDPYSYRWPQDNTRCCKLCDRPGKVTNEYSCTTTICGGASGLTVLGKQVLLSNCLNETNNSLTYKTTVFLVLFYSAYTIQEWIIWVMKIIQQQFFNQSGFAYFEK